VATAVDSKSTGVVDTWPLHAVILGTYWDTLTSLDYFDLHFHQLSIVCVCEFALDPYSLKKVKFYCSLFKPSWLILERIDLLSKKKKKNNWITRVIFVLCRHQFWYSWIILVVFFEEKNHKVKFRFEKKSTDLWPSWPIVFAIDICWFAFVKYFCTLALEGNKQKNVAEKRKKERITHQFI
jgi:hypothetical protein